MTLTAAARADLRARLLVERNALLEQVRKALEQRGQTQYAEILGRASGDSADEALAVSLGDLSAAWVDLEMRRLRQLEAALARMASQDYGLCADCGTEIPLARLQANPGALRCIACQEIFEKTHGGAEHGSL